MSDLKQILENIDKKQLIKLLNSFVSKISNTEIQKIDRICSIHITNKPNIVVFECGTSRKNQSIGLGIIPVKVELNGNEIEKLSLTSLRYDGNIEFFYKEDLEKNGLTYQQTIEIPFDEKKKTKRYTLKNFKLTPAAAKYIEFGNIQKQMLSDMVEYLKAGGDPFGGDDSVKFYELDNYDVGALSLYKNDPVHVSPNRIDKVVDVLTKHYKHICEKPLYRGVSEAELNGIMKQINSGKTTFLRDKTTSFTTSYKHAENFAQYGGGSIVDVGKKRKAGAVLTVYCKKPLVYVDEWIFYSCMAYNIAGIDDCMSQKEALENTMYECEWLLPKNYKWKVVDKDNLVFEIS